MSYQVLARKWRPRRFAELVGQEHVVRALENGLASGRLHHAFLFTGTRGVGKTTIARIIAKALNCERGVGADPCGVCGVCVDVDQGRFVDLIEVDAASRTKVDDTRELLDNVIYAPARGRYKVYLIDEVHMLSTHSFNALLKTLEEPPDHVKFLLATTDPQKLPVTVLSRCLKFHLKRMTVAQVQGQMRHILEQEGIPCDEEALQELARAADGSMRDGLSLLDQAIGHGHGRVEAVSTREMLGSVARDGLLDLLLAVANADQTRAWEEVQALVAANPDFLTVCGQLQELLHDAALHQVLGAQAGVLEPPAKLLELAARSTPDALQLYYQICLLATRDLALAPVPRVAFEMAMLRLLAFTPEREPTDGAGGGALGGGRRGSASAANANDASSRAAAPVASAAQLSPTASVSAPGQGGPASSVRVAVTAPPPGPGAGVLQSVTIKTPVPQSGEEPSGAALERYAQWCAELALGGPVGELARQCSVDHCAPERVDLVLAPDWAYLLSPANRDQLESQLRTRHPGLNLGIRVGASNAMTLAERESRQQRARREHCLEQFRSDPLVRALEHRCDARLRIDSVRVHA